MASIGGASLLDILSQGGQFLGGRQQAQQAQAAAQQEAMQKHALEMALIEQRQASAAESRARAQAASMPDPLTTAQTEGAVAGVQRGNPMATADEIAGMFPGADLLAIQNVLAKQAEQKAAMGADRQERATEAFTKADQARAGGFDAQVKIQGPPALAELNAGNANTFEPYVEQGAYDPANDAVSRQRDARRAPPSPAAADRAEAARVQQDALDAIAGGMPVNQVLQLATPEERVMLDRKALEAYAKSLTGDAEVTFGG